LKKILSLTLASTLIFLSGCLKSEPNLGKASFFKVVSSSYAKELCSCLFVVEQELEYCRRYSKQLLPVSSEKIDRNKKTVGATALGITSIAVYRSKRFGCGLLGD
jgi:hypothetical protein